jgi:type I restriction enzyme S subunit
MALYGQGKTRGRVSILGIQAATNQACASISVSPIVSSKYVFHFLSSQYEAIRGLSNSGSQNNLTGEIVKSLQVVVPSTKHEQEVIAEALSDADALIESLEQLLAKKRQIKQGAMQELLTGKKRLPGFGKTELMSTELGPLPVDWHVRHIGEIATVKTGPFGSSLHERDYVDDGTPIITVEHLGEQGISHDGLPMVCEADRKRLKSYLLEEGDIVFSRVGSVDRNARVSIAEDGWMFSGRLLRLRANSADIDTKYLSYHFHSEEFKQRVRTVAVGQTMASLNTQILKRVLAILPPLPEQSAIAEILSEMDCELQTLESKLRKARQIKDGMMQELLTGRIRLVQPSAEVVPFPVKQSASAGVNATHNPQINEAVVLAVLAHRFGSEQFPLGRFRRTKLSYLLHRHVERQVAGFMKKAAGPYSPQTRYGGAEKIALKNGYVCIHKTAKGEGFVAANNIAQAEGYFESWYGLQVLDWLTQFRYKKNEELELLTTVDMAIEDLRRDGKSVTVSAVKRIIHDSPEWKAKLDRATFADSNITAAIESCHQLFPVEE